MKFSKLFKFAAVITVASFSGCSKNEVIDVPVDVSQYTNGFSMGSGHGVSSLGGSKVPSTEREASGQVLENIDKGRQGDWNILAHEKAKSTGGEFDFRTFDTINDDALGAEFNKSAGKFDEMVIPDQLDYQVAIRWLDGVKLLSKFIDINEHRVPVAVIDTGINETAIDLAGHVEGKVDARTPGGPATDLDGHGTAVAGVIGAIATNDLGIHGLAINPRLFAVKVLATPDDTKTGTNLENENTLISALDDILDLRKFKELPYVVCNASIGGYQEAPGMKDKYRELYETGGVVMVSASGNEYDPTGSQPAYQGREDLNGGVAYTVSVGGYHTNNDGSYDMGKTAFFGSDGAGNKFGSNYNKSTNPEDQWVHVAAPCMRIFTLSAGLIPTLKKQLSSVLHKKGLTAEDQDLINKLYPVNPNLYTKETGTSLASPIVTGMIAASIIKPLLHHKKFGEGKRVYDLVFKSCQLSPATKDNPNVLEWTKYGNVDMPTMAAIGLVFAGEKAEKVKAQIEELNIEVTDELLEYLKELEAERDKANAQK